MPTCYTWKVQPRPNPAAERQPTLRSLCGLLKPFNPLEKHCPIPWGSATAARNGEGSLPGVNLDALREVRGKVLAGVGCACNYKLVGINKNYKEG